MTLNKSFSVTDGKERQEALDPSRSFIVQAPAGSGKTELLMQRYLKLLSLVERPEDILALTFTRKAAGEMQNRILNALLKARSGSVPSEPHQARTISLADDALRRSIDKGWELIENPGRLKVQTIDSFCSSITRQMPLLSGLGRQLSLTEEPEELYRKAAELTVELVEDDGPGGEAIRRGLKHLDNSVKALSDRIVMMLGKRDQWLRHLKRNHEGSLKPLLEGSLGNIIEWELTRIRSLFPPGMGERIAAIGRYAAAHIEKGGPIRDLALLEGLPPASAVGLPEWRGIKELLLLKDGALRKPGGVTVSIGFPAVKSGTGAEMKREFQDLLLALEGKEEVLSAVARISVLPDPSFTEEEWETLDALLHILPIAERRLFDVFGREGAVDFQAVSMAAIEALGSDDEPTDLMLALDMKLKHILVDEYQDTSYTQLALLKALTRGWTHGDGRTLFIVGDPMQSIYLFREAEVGLFLEARSSGVGDIGLTPLVLRSNFRSQANIVEWVNSSFAGAFPENEDSLKGAIRFEPSTPTRPAVEGLMPRIRLFEGRDDRAEADEVAAILKTISEGETAAILCRSRAHLGAIVEVLKDEGISFRAQGIDRLDERPAVRDLYALLRALSHPFDRVAWLAALRAPWCGLALRDLHALCLGDRTGPVWKLLHDERRLNSLTPEGRERAGRFIPEMEKALELMGRTPLRGLVEGLWIALGGPACVEDPSELNDAEAFLSLVEGMEAEGGAFSIKRLEERMEGLYADNGGTSSVRVDLMTIHKAKGLEFDHVIIPGLGRKAKGQDKKLLLWMERGDDLLLAPVEKKGSKERCGIYDYLFGIGREKERLEQIRLFYVAATRARKQLYLLGHVKEREDGEFKVEGGSFLHSLKGILTEDMIVPSREVDGAADKSVNMVKRLPLRWTLPSPEGPVVTVKGLKETALQGPEFYWAGEGARHLGTVVHRYLCRIAREGLDAWGGKRAAGEKERIKSALRTLGLNPSEAESRALEGVEIIMKALAEERGRWILGPRERGGVEVPMTGVFGGDVARAVIDRTFIDGGDRWIIDYKTGAHEGGSLDEFLSSEKERYMPQLERYETLLRGAGEGRRIRKGLYYPAIGAWIEW